MNGAIVCGRHGGKWRRRLHAANRNVDAALLRALPARNVPSLRYGCRQLRDRRTARVDRHTGEAVGFGGGGSGDEADADSLYQRFSDRGRRGFAPATVPGTAFVDRGTKPTGSPTYPLDVLAAFSSDRKKFLISVVNPTEEGHSFTPKISGVKLRGQGKLYQIAPPSLNSTNEAGKEPVVKIVETAQNGVPETVEVPAVSVSLYEFEIA
jgi:hypothetical protein